MASMYTGRVIMFKKQRGFGYIEPDAGSNLGEKVFCHWKSIKTNDKWPTLEEGMRVSFKAERDEKDPNRWKATEVYTEDGEAVGDGEEEEEEEESVNYLLNGKKFKGMVKSWNKSSGVGLIKVDEKGVWPLKGVKVDQDDVHAINEPPSLRPGIRVEFQISKDDETGIYEAKNVCAPGGEKVKNLPGQGRKKREIEGEENESSASKRPRVEPQPQEPEPIEPEQPEEPEEPEQPPQPEPEPINTTITSNNAVSSALEDEFENDDTIVEIGLFIRCALVGVLIGKKGATIKEIRKLSSANMKFGDDDVEVEKDTQCERVDKYRVLAISGSKKEVSTACKVIAQKIAESEQNLEFKIVFLVPEDYCGMFIGKKGANIKEMKGEADQRVRINLGRESLQLPGANKVTLCTVNGPRLNTQKAMERIVKCLGDISAKMQELMNAEQQNQWTPNYSGGFQKGYGGGFQGGQPRGAASGWGGGGGGLSRRSEYGASSARAGASGYGASLSMGPQGTYSDAMAGGGFGGGAYSASSFGGSQNQDRPYSTGGWGARGGGQVSRGGY